ncbi:hypothetical protein H8D98_00430 [bacterium]|nr:hypothetical protein [bacterium]
MLIKWDLFPVFRKNVWHILKKRLNSKSYNWIIIGEEGGSATTNNPAPGGSSNQVTIIGTKDDRVIQTKPLDIFGQYNFIIAEAVMARLTRQKNLNTQRDV